MDEYPIKEAKFLEILKKLNEEEFRLFGQFVNSPVFNRLKSVVLLYEILKKHYPEFSARSFTAEAIYSKIFREEKFSYFKMKNLESDMLRLEEEFLAFINYNKNIFQKKLFLLNEMYERSLFRNSAKKIKDAENFLEKIETQGEQFFDNKFRLEFIKANFISKNEVSTDYNLLDVTGNLINFFMIKMLKLYIYKITDDMSYKSDFSKLLWLDEMISYIKKNINSCVPAVRIYYYILMSIVSDDKKNYDELNKLKNEYSKAIDRDELEDLFKGLMNFCTRMVVKGQEYYMKDYLSLSRERLSLERDNIVYNQFINTIMTAIKSGEFEWAEKFIEEFKEKIFPEHRAFGENFGYALLHFEKKDFEFALNSLNKIDFNDYHDKLKYRNLLLQIYYEIGYFEEALSLIDSYRHYMSREESITELYMARNQNFIKFYNDILKIRLGIKGNEAFQIRKNIMDTDEVINKSWLLKKLEEIMK